MSGVARGQLNGVVHDELLVSDAGEGCDAHALCDDASSQLFEVLCEGARCSQLDVLDVQFDDGVGRDRHDQAPVYVETTRAAMIMRASFKVKPNSVLTRVDARMMNSLLRYKKQRDRVTGFMVARVWSGKHPF